MSSDDDIALSLPTPPPPQPARRAQAIDAALRRFDAADAPVDRPRAAGSPAWWTQLNRPQVGVLVSGMLAVLIGVPAVWVAYDSSPVAVRPATPARVVDTAPAPGLAGSQPVVVAAPPPASAPPSAVDRMTAITADVEARSSTASPPAPTAETQSAVAPPPPPPPPAPAPQEAPRSRAVAEAALPLADAAAPAPPAMAFAPPAPAPVIAQRAFVPTNRAAESITVTGSRLSASARRGDWNACTVNDPSRSLAGCKQLFDPGAKGREGRAAARLADGLMRAWQNDFGGAIAAFDRAIDIAPQDAFAYLNRGLAHQRAGDLDRAIADLDRAVRYAPNARNHYNRGQLLRERGDAGRAAGDEARAVALDPSYATVVE